MRKVDNDKYNKIIGNELRIERERKRMSQEDVAKKVGLARGTISAYEVGTRPMNISTLKNICDICKFNYIRILYNSFKDEYPEMIKILAMDKDMEEIMKDE